MITFDSLMLKAFIEEQKEFIVGARINKIQQPTRREIILSLRNNGETKLLYINIDTKLYHVCFMSDFNAQTRLIEIPDKPPMFCMLLRKYINNSKIAKVVQPDGERILELYFETYNEIGDKIYLCLAIELMGKHSNVILYNTDTNIILGCAHNVGADKSQVREVYGQIPYTYPPLNMNNDFLTQRYAFLNSFNHNIYQDEVNDILDNYYAVIIANKKFKIFKSQYLSIVKRNLLKVEKSLQVMENQLNKSVSAENYRRYGDILMANLYNLNDYSPEANVFDYENNTDITIPLKASKSIKENANDYYKKYNKGKMAEVKLNELIDANKKNKEYLESVLYSIEISKNINELNEIELTKYISIKDGLKALPVGRGITCIERDNQTRIYIGKNNKQNDYIVSKLAQDEDLWFHTKDCAGSHVLLKAQNPTDELIIECAKLAKENSRGRYSSKIGVVYTKRKYLRKPPKANLGYVTYKNEKEIIID